MRTLTCYFSQKSKDGLEILPQLKELCEENDIVPVDICIDGNRDLEDRFSGFTPVVLIGPYRLNSPFTLQEIEIAIKAMKNIDTENESLKGQTTAALTFSKTESFTLWFSRSYVWVLSIFLILFVGITFLAPVFELTGNTRIAGGIYKVYSILCHQLSYRSYFIGGEQAFYPRELAHIKGVITYEEVTGRSADDVLFSRSFVGNSFLGYKVALCERDIAIYLSMALFGILYQVTGKRFNGLPWYFWFIFALVPIALDGFSQLPGLAEGWPTWLPIRESTPFLRTLTGVLFGAGTAWYMYPLMEETMKESRFNLARKMEIVKKINQKAAL